MNDDRLATPPPFSADLASLIWPMFVQDFLGRAMHSEILFERGSPERLALLEEPLGGFDLRYLFAHGGETTIWKEGGFRTTRGSDSERDAGALVPGTTIQTHLQGNLAFGRRFTSSVARQMRLETGFFSIFASLDAHTATHFDRNYNFTIQLCGEKTWTVYAGEPAITHPSDNMAFDPDHLTPMRPQLHGVALREPHGSGTRYRLQPGDLLYVPPGFWHATECKGLAVALNVSLEPHPWLQVIGDALLRELQAHPEWRAPLGAPTREQATQYVQRLRQIVAGIAPEDLMAEAAETETVQMDEPLRRTFGSLLMWEKSGAGVHYSADELRFVAKGTRGRLLDTAPAALEPALALLAALERPKSMTELSTEAGVDADQLRDFVCLLAGVGYLAPADRRDVETSARDSRAHPQESDSGT